MKVQTFATKIEPLDNDHEDTSTDFNYLNEMENKKILAKII